MFCGVHVFTFDLPIDPTRSCEEKRMYVRDSLINNRTLRLKGETRRFSTRVAVK